MLALAYKLGAQSMGFFKLDEWMKGMKELEWVVLCLYSRVILTLCRAQHPKTSARGSGRNIPKCPVAIGKLCCFQTRKFPYNLARISWIVTVRDFHYFVPRHLHWLCVRSESERVFLKSSRKNALPVFETGLSSMIQTKTNNSMAFVLKILSFKKL